MIRHGSHQGTEASKATTREIGTTDLSPEMAGSWRREGREEGRGDWQESSRNLQVRHWNCQPGLDLSTFCLCPTAGLMLRDLAQD